MTPGESGLGIGTTRNHTRIPFSHFKAFARPEAVIALKRILAEDESEKLGKKTQKQSVRRSCCTAFELRFSTLQDHRVVSRVCIGDVLDKRREKEREIERDRMRPCSPKSSLVFSQHAATLLSPAATLCTLSHTDTEDVILSRFVQAR